MRNQKEIAPSQASGPVRNTAAAAAGAIASPVATAKWPTQRGNTGFALPCGPVSRYTASAEQQVLGDEHADRGDQA